MNQTTYPCGNTINDRRTSRTITSIKREFLILLQNAPAEKIKVMQLCRSCDINRTTFYRYFNDVHHVLEELQEDCLIQLNALHQEILSNAYGSQQIVDMFLTFIDENRALLHVFMPEKKEDYFWRRFNESILNLFRASVLRRNPALSQKNAETLENTLAFLTAGFYAIYRRWLEDYCKEDIHSLIQTATMLSDNCIACLLDC